MNDVTRAAELYHPYVEAYPHAQALSDHAALTARAGVSLFGGDYLPGLVAILREAIAGGRPFAAIRIGDGEGNLLASAETDQTELRAHAVRQILRNMFGRDDFDAAAVARLRGLIEQAILDADVLGVRNRGQLARTYDEPRARQADGQIIKNVRGLIGSVESVRMIRQLFDRAGKGPPVLTECSFHLGLLPEYPSLLGGLDFLGLVGRSAALGPALKTAFGIGEVAVSVVPGQSKGAFRSDHYPDVFDRLCEEVEVPFPGAVFLVAAGVLGKPYCSVLKAKGAVVIDVGSVFDIWLGELTRGKFTDEMIERWRLVR